jgi:hypothetical protein
MAKLGHDIHSEANKFIWRASAFATADPLIRGVLLTLLGETETEALNALRYSCWRADLSEDETEQRSLLRRSLLSFVPEHIRPAGWPGGTL